MTEPEDDMHTQMVEVLEYAINKFEEITGERQHMVIISVGVPHDLPEGAPYQPVIEVVSDAEAQASINMMRMGLMTVAHEVGAAIMQAQQETKH